MNWITISWPMVAAACLTMGLIELRIGLAQPQHAARLFFALSAFAIACIAGLELALMRSNVLAEWWPLMRLMDIAVGVMMVSLTAFIWVYFGTGNKWLALGVPVLYATGLAFDYQPGRSPGSGMTYQTVTTFRTVETLGGATFNVAEGVPNLWNVFPYLAALTLIVFAVDASVRLLRSGGRRRAAFVGGATALFLLVAGVQSALVETGILRMPYMISWAYLALLIVMADMLNADVLAAARLAVQLWESERRMDLASSAANLGMWVWDIVGDTIWANGKARALFGFSGSEHISFARFMSVLHPRDREAVEHAVENALTFDQDLEAEYRVSLPEGQTRWIASRGQVERDTKGKPVRMRGVVLDVSARRNTEAELQQLRSQLAHASRVSMMGQLASALAHELSQPLGAILRNTEAAELFLQHDPPDLDELRAILVDIRQDDQRAGAVIERLRALLKRRSFASRALSVGELLDSVAALTRIDSVARFAHLEIEASPRLPAVMGDPVHLQQVLLNLVLNAMDAVNDVPVERRRVTVRAERRGEREVEVAVSDSGHGIASNKLGQLFEPFFTTKENGLGIGLSISRTIIEAHGGRIWAENNGAEGATFRFTLPLAEEAAPA
jgi:two-component system sensor kinase FixL